MEEFVVNVSGLADRSMTQIEEHIIRDIYSGVRGIAVKVLIRIERADSYLDKLLEHEMKTSDLSTADKALLYELVHGVIRWQGRLDWLLAGFYKGQFSKAIPVLKNALRIALYQMVFLDKIPDYAAVNEAVEFVKKLQGQKPANITNAVLRNMLRSKNEFRYPVPEENLAGYLAAYYSHPSWLIKRWVKRFGREQTEAMMVANNERPALTLRINSLKVNRQQFRYLLDTEKLRYTEGGFLKEFFKLHNLSNITEWKYYGEGFFSIQDESAGMACRLLDAQPGMRVLDLCAAPGGKSTYIAEIMQNKGEVVSIDRFETRLRLLDSSLERLGITIVRTLAMDVLEYKDEALFDRVLVDAPCSGLGTLSKKPDIKWKKELLDIRHLAELQYKLLQKASTLVKPGGIVVYSTCTTEPEENEDIITRFLRENPDFVLDKEHPAVPNELITPDGYAQTFPHTHKTDGAFAARLKKQ